MPRRQPAPGGSAFAVERMFCVRTPMQEQPVVLPAVLVGGHWAVPLGAYEPWLGFALDGRARASSAGHVVAFVNAACSALAEALGDGDAGDTTPPPAPNAAKGRAALDLESDSDEEALEAVGREPRRSGGGARAPPDWRTVEVQGLELRLHRGKGRRLLIPVEGEDLAKLLSHLRQKADEEEPLATPCKKRRMRDYGESPTDAGRVRWNEALACFLVRYRDAKGSIRQVSKGFGLPTVNACGDPLSEAEREIVRAGLLGHARRRWNELDQTDAARYPEEQCATSGSCVGARAPTVG